MNEERNREAKKQRAARMSEEKKDRKREHRGCVGYEEWTKNIWWCSYPKPMHNFLVLVEPWERNPESTDMIHEINTILSYIQGTQHGMYDTLGQTDFESVKGIKFHVTKKIGYLLQELKKIPMNKAVSCVGGVLIDSRDNLMNLGVAFFVVGLYLVMMSSNTRDDLIAKAVNYHLQKSCFIKKDVTCDSCGHMNCPGGQMCMLPVVANESMQTGWI